MIVFFAMRWDSQRPPPNTSPAVEPRFQISTGARSMIAYNVAQLLNKRLVLNREQYNDGQLSVLVF